MNAKQLAALQAFDIAAAKTGELVEFFNKHSDKPVKKFADRKTAEKRCRDLVAAIVADREEKAKAAAAKSAKITKRSKKELAAEVAAARQQAVKEGRCPNCGKAGDITHGRIVERGGHQHEVDMHVGTCHKCGHDFNVNNGKPAKYTGGTSNEARSVAIAQSWSNPEVAAKRAMRTHVKVNGVEYRSVREAFKALGLPDSKHIKFRMELKAAGKKSFDGKVFVTVNPA